MLSMYVCLGIHISGLLGSGTVDCHYQKQTLIRKPALVFVPIRFVQFLRYFGVCFPGDALVGTRFCGILGLSDGWCVATLMTRMYSKHFRSSFF